MNSDNIEDATPDSAQPATKSNNVRLVVLLAILAIVASAFAYDRFVLLAAGKTATENIVKACSDLSADQATVHKAAGSEPQSTEKIGEHVVEHWSYDRLFPNLRGYKISVVYLNGTVVESYPGGIMDAEREYFLR